MKFGILLPAQLVSWPLAAQPLDDLPSSAAMVATAEWNEPVWSNVDYEKIGSTEPNWMSCSWQEPLNASFERDAKELPKIDFLYGTDQGDVKPQQLLTDISLAAEKKTAEKDSESAKQDLGNMVLKTEIEILETLWNVSFNLGMDGMQDKSNQLRFGTVASFTLPDKKLEIDLDYERGQSGSNEISNRLILDGRQEWYLDASRWSHYLRGTVEYNQVQDFDSRLTTDVGFAYSILKNPLSRLKVSAGTGVSREFGRQNAELTPDALYGLSFNQKITSGQQLKTSLDYIPEWSDFSQYRLNARADWRIIVDKDIDLLLNIGARNRYDSQTPLTTFEAGLDYTTTLMWVY